MLAFLWNATRGYRLHPWDSPYLKWRIETYWGIPADSLDRDTFLRFTWSHRSELLRFLHWASRMRHST